MGPKVGWGRVSTDGMMAVSQDDAYSDVASLKPAGWVWIGHKKETTSASTSV